VKTSRIITNTAIATIYFFVKAWWSNLGQTWKNFLSKIMVPKRCLANDDNTDDDTVTKMRSAN
jgi:hypothetical protein